MKWGSATKHGDTRILKKYAWFPNRNDKMKEIGI